MQPLRVDPLRGTRLVPFARAAGPEEQRLGLLWLLVSAVAAAVRAAAAAAAALPSPDPSSSQKTTLPEDPTDSPSIAPAILPPYTRTHRAHHPPASP
jgi:hypothetical protein